MRSPWVRGARVIRGAARSPQRVPRAATRRLALYPGCPARPRGLRAASSDPSLQVASLALHNAIDRFEPDRGSKFTSYAAPTILGELKRRFRDKGWALHVPRDLQERTLAVSRETEALSKRLGRSPKPREVAQGLGCSVEQVL